MRFLKVIALLLVASVCAFGQAVRLDMLVSTDWLANHLNDPKVVILHIGRDTKSYDAGHIPGAKFLALSSIAGPVAGNENELLPAAQLEKAFGDLGITNQTRVILYGDMNGLFAARAFFTLDYLGHGDDAALLDGGLEKWRKEGRQVSTEAVISKAAQFTARIQPQTIVMMQVVRDISHEVLTANPPNFSIIDARPREEYEGVKPGHDIKRTGHIPGAKSVFWMQNLESAENPVMRSVAQLKRLYAEQGVTPSRTVVTYCRTGVQASFTYFVMRYLGYDTMMYDGSYLEWSSAETNPVATGSQ